MSILEKLYISLDFRVKKIKIELNWSVMATVLLNGSDLFDEIIICDGIHFGFWYKRRKLISASARLDIYWVDGSIKGILINTAWLLMMKPFNKLLYPPKQYGTLKLANRKLLSSSNFIYNWPDHYVYMSNLWE